MNFSANRGIRLIKGENATIYDDCGRTYIDLASAHGVAAVGHAHPAVARAVAFQSQHLLSCPGSFSNDARDRLISALSRVTPPALNRFFFCNSGTEAVEAALKLAAISNGRSRFVAFKRSFHGRTIGALGVTWPPGYREPFHSLLPQVTFLPFNQVEGLIKAIDHTVAAVIVEGVQGEGGVYPARADFLCEIQSACNESDACLILDEIQTGGGRTGKFWAHSHFGVTPDIICFAKALGGGFPFGGIACGPRIMEKPGIHGSTFGGNPVACAAAAAALSIIESQDLCVMAAEKGEIIIEQLQREPLPGVRDIRGLGCMVGIELEYAVTPLLKRLQARGVIALAAGPHVMRLLPPLTIPEEQLLRALDTLITLLKNPHPKKPCS